MSQTKFQAKLQCRTLASSSAYMLCLLAYVLFLGSAAIAQENSAPPTPEQDNPLAAGQTQLAARFKKLEGILLRSAEVEAVTNPTRAQLMQQAAALAKQVQLSEAMVRAARSLEQKQYSQAIEDQKASLENLNKILELLQSENRSDRVREQRDQIRRTIEETQRLLRLQSSLRGRTEGGTQTDKAASDQQKLAEKAAQIAEELSPSAKDKNDSEGKDSADGKNKDGTPSADKKSEDKKSEDKKSEDKQSEDKNPQDKKLDDKKSDNAEGKDQKSGDQKSGDQKSGEQGAKDKNGDKPSDGSKNNDKNQDGDSKKKDKSEGDKSEGDKSEGDKPEGDKSASEDPSGQPQSTPKQSKQNKQGQQGQPGEQPQQQPGGEQSEEEQSQDPNQPQQPKSPTDGAAKRLKQAQKQMQEAQEKLKEAERKGAVEKQRQAEQELKTAIEELEEILRQLREEEIERSLTALEERLRLMLQLQNKVLDESKRLQDIGAGANDRQVEIRANNLANDEKKIVNEAQRALLLLREEGTSAAFPESLSHIITDMQKVVDRLAKADLGKLTISIEEDIVSSLEELVAAMSEIKKENKERKENQMQMPGQQGQPGEQPLVNQLAEMRLIKTLQLRINKRTQTLSEVLKDPTDVVGQAEAADIQGQLRELAERQASIKQVTRDIVIGKNKQ